MNNQKKITSFYTKKSHFFKAKILRHMLWSTWRLTGSTARLNNFATINNKERESDTNKV